MIGSQNSAYTFDCWKAEFLGMEENLILGDRIGLSVIIVRRHIGIYLHVQPACVYLYAKRNSVTLDV